MGRPAAAAQQQSDRRRACTSSIAGWCGRMRDNMPYDRFARELLTAEGSTYANPPANYLSHGRRYERLHRDDLAIVPGHSHPMRQVPQPSVRALDAGQLLRHRRVLQSRADASRASTPEEKVDLGRPQRRSHAAAHRQADEALAAAEGRRRLAGRRRSPRSRSPTG